MPMEILLLLLLLVLAGAWWSGFRIGRHNGEQKGSSGLSNHYFQGLNFLLNEQPDKAIESFMKMLEVDSETVETHLALGNLFRRRGETDRAIRIHQNLIARPTLSPEERGRALYELGQDYMRAGILSRAENIFADLQKDKQLGIAAMEALVEIYQQERDWEKAVEVLRKYQSSTGRSQNPVISQYYCELAEASLHKGALEKAARYLKQAFGTDRQCVRASLLEAELYHRQGNDRAAIKSLKRVEQQNPLYLSEAVRPMLESYRALGKLDEAIDYIGSLIRNHHDNVLALALVDVVREVMGDDKAVGFMAEQMRQQVSVGGLRKLIDLNLGTVQGQARENLLILRELTEKLMKNKPTYRCDQCGFEGKIIHWQCPTCKTWGSIRPIREFAN